MSSKLARIVLIIALFDLLTHAKTPISNSLFAPAAQTSESNLQTPSSSDVHVRLVLAENKTTFRIGDPIRLIMEFTADAQGYSVDTMEDKKQPTSDSVSITPETGLTRWLDEMNRGSTYSRDVFGPKPLSSEPVRVGLTLNDTIRFDRPGKYTVRVVTRRVTTGTGLVQQKSITLTTNEVTFDLRLMTIEEEQEELKRIAALLNAKRDFQTDESVGARLSYLTGDESTREKVRRFLNPEDRSGNFAAHIWYGLFIAPNRQLVLQLLESAIRDVHQPVSRTLLNAVSTIRFLQDNRATPSPVKTASFMISSTGDPRFTAIQNNYLEELALNLTKRTGQSLTTTAMTILMTAQKERADWVTTTSEARRVLVQHFSTLHPFAQDSLLRGYGDDLRDPAMIAHLKKMLSYSGTASKNIHDSAMQRLIEWAPEEARPYVVKFICDPASLPDTEILDKLSDKSLPEVDSCLLEQLRQQKDRQFLDYKAVLAVRFATENIYNDVKQIYLANESKLPLEVKAGLLAYLAKHNEREALPLIEATLAGLEDDYNFLPKLTKLYYSPAIANIVKARLESNTPERASHAAYLLGVHGIAGDEVVLQSRLDRWRKEWASRPAEADTNLQGMIERELTYALLHGKSWKLTPERSRELKLSCVTKFCKQSNP